MSSTAASTASGSANCYGTGANACQNSNITQFAVGGNGILTPQETFYTQGINPFRMIADASGNYLFVLDHDAPDNAKPLRAPTTCALRPGKLGHHLRRHHRLQDRPDHRPFVAGCECPGDGSQRPADQLFPGSGQPRRFCLVRQQPFSPSPARQLQPRTRTPAAPRSSPILR